MTFVICSMALQKKLFASCAVCVLCCLRHVLFVSCAVCVLCCLCLVLFVSCAVCVLCCLCLVLFVSCDFAHSLAPTKSADDCIVPEIHDFFFLSLKPSCCWKHIYMQSKCCYKELPNTIGNL